MVNQPVLIVDDEVEMRMNNSVSGGYKLNFLCI